MTDFTSVCSPRRLNIDLMSERASKLSPLIERLVHELGINGEKLESSGVASAALSAPDQRPSKAQWRYLFGKALEQMQTK